MKLQRLKNELAAIWFIAAKDIKIYYSKPSVLMFGIMFPVFMFLSFLIRRQIGPAEVFGGLSSMTLFFMASSIGPVVIPLEKRQGTYDRFISAPLSLQALILGKTVPGLVFGIVIALLPLSIGLLFGSQIQNILILGVALLLGGLAFSTLGILLSSFQAERTGSVMIGMNFIRLPSLFVSGIFLPLNEMPQLFVPISLLSPLTYAHDLVNWSLDTGIPFFHWIFDIIGLVILSLLFLWLSIWLHERARRRT